MLATRGRWLFTLLATIVISLQVVVTIKAIQTPSRGAVAYYEIQFQSKQLKKWATIGTSDAPHCQFGLSCEDDEYRIRVRARGKFGPKSKRSEPSKPFTLQDKQWVVAKW